MRKSYRAGGIIVNEDGKIALSNEHLWGFPRGGVEQGETYEQAAKREILEETGLEDIEIVKEIGQYDRYPTGVDENTPGAYPMEIHIFLCHTNYTGALNPKDPNVKEAEWFTLEEAINKLTDSKDREFLVNHKEEIF
jgi:8-oxo-dGTP pyrophosphatase MutT (NUDIX family)